MSLCQIVREPIRVEDVIAAVQRPEAGAVALFLGTVRNHNQGQSVTLLEYEAYESMALKEMGRIMAELEAELPGVVLGAVHRIGKLEVGAAAVACAASSPHRDAAFTAGRQLIDRIKARVPIWKREHTADGEYWVNWEDARVPPPEER